MFPNAFWAVSKLVCTDINLCDHMSEAFHHQGTAESSWWYSVWSVVGVVSPARRRTCVWGFGAMMRNACSSSFLFFELDCKSAIVKPQVNLLPTNKDWSVWEFPQSMQEVGCCYPGYLLPSMQYTASHFPGCTLSMWTLQKRILNKRNVLCLGKIQSLLSCFFGD